MNFAELRKRNKQLQKMYVHCDKTVVHFLSKVLQLDGNDFVWELYRQILEREPEKDSLQALATQASSSRKKFAIILKMMQSKEAKKLYANNQLKNNEQTVLKFIRECLCTQNEDFILKIYEHFLLRKPRQEEWNDQIQRLQQGISRIKIIFRLIYSEEFRKLLMALAFASKVQPEREHLHKGRSKVEKSFSNNVTIGVFLCYSIKIHNFDGEGIGRFVIRLLEGMLKNNGRIKTIIAIEALNYGVIQQAFQTLLKVFPAQIKLIQFETIGWLNENVMVDGWIVPYAGMKQAADLKQPMILCLHDLVYTHFQGMYKQNKIFYDQFHETVKKVVEKAKKIVFHSEFIRNHEGLRVLKLPIEKTCVIRLAAPREEYSSSAVTTEEAFRNKYKLYGNYMTYPTVFRWHKNIERLIEAFLRFSKNYPEADLKFVFTDHYVNSPLAGKIKDILQKEQVAGFRNRIIFLGRLPWADISLLYKYAIGTVVPTLFEGSCPFQMLESLLMGTPVAVSNMEVVKEIVHDLNVFVPFNPYQIEEIERALFNLWKQHNHLLPKQLAAFRSTLERTWSDVSSEYLALMHELIG